jgi:hypothetical protein
LHHYIQRGFKPEDIINLDAWSKEFYFASMMLYFDEERKKYEALSPGGK